MNLKKSLFLFSLILFSCLHAAEIDDKELKEAQKAFYKAAVENKDIAAMEAILKGKPLEVQKQIVQHPHEIITLNAKDGITIEMTPLISLCRLDENAPTNEETLNAIKYIVEHEAFNPNYKHKNKKLHVDEYQQLDRLLIYTFQLAHAERLCLTESIKEYIVSKKCTKETSIAASSFLSVCYALADDNERKKSIQSLKSIFNFANQSELWEEAPRDAIGEAAGNLLIPLITALICAYDYSSFKQKTKKLKIAENQEEDSKNIDGKPKQNQKEEKPSKLKAYFSDLKTNPLEHKKLWISLPVGIVGLIAFNAI